MNNNFQFQISFLQKLKLTKADQIFLLLFLFLHIIRKFVDFHFSVESTSGVVRVESTGQEVHLGLPKSRLLLQEVLNKNQHRYFFKKSDIKVFRLSKPFLLTFLYDHFYLPFSSSFLKCHSTEYKCQFQSHPFITHLFKSPSFVKKI